MRPPSRRSHRPTQPQPETPLAPLPAPPLPASPPPRAILLRGLPSADFKSWSSRPELGSGTGAASLAWIRPRHLNPATVRHLPRRGAPLPNNPRRTWPASTGMTTSITPRPSLPIPTASCIPVSCHTGDPIPATSFAPTTRAPPGSTRYRTFMRCLPDLQGVQAATFIIMHRISQVAAPVRRRRPETTASLVCRHRISQLLLLATSPTARHLLPPPPRPRATELPPLTCSGRAKNSSSHMKNEEGKMQQSEKQRSHFKKFIYLE